MSWTSIFLHVVGCWAIFAAGHFIGYTKAETEPRDAQGRLIRHQPHVYNKEHF